MKFILYVALFVSLITYLFWSYLPKGSFYVGNSLFIMLICFYIFVTDRKSAIKFILFSLSINNLLDELFFDNTILQINEIITGICILIFALIRKINDR